MSVISYMRDLFLLLKVIVLPDEPQTDADGVSEPSASTAIETRERSFLL